MHERVERGEILGGLRIGGTPESAPRVARESPMPWGSIVVGNQ